ncbi:hypothetical protein FHX82_003130 [Amycolatopsis bartoniae]|uniref:Uncharacterized protein n=1 Tax=Amycolatopsis bartoniae TaxID=941986 RepID=A0A8H9MCN6_9PSEU|nr:hypothetical protein [Amycolatopsis bartoniae]MBB2936076.1 hypothetical protein [Amycolatopsis bartoniae]TVT03561.1 hypothetical protein FNH07_25365 [Amycolatopsis bartoniae]GHF63959.1 hypothetical protein GCM10017566_42070 [Amycolatopsis bartoniae]
MDLFEQQKLHGNPLEYVPCTWSRTPIRFDLRSSRSTPLPPRSKHLDGALVGHLPASGPDPVVLKPAELTITVDDTDTARLRILPDRARTHR